MVGGCPFTAESPLGDGISNIPAIAGLQSQEYSPLLGVSDAVVLGVQLFHITSSELRILHAAATLA